RKGKQILKNDPYTLLKKIRKEILEHKKFYASVGMEDLDPYYMYRQWIDVVNRMEKLKYSYKAFAYRGLNHSWEYVSKDLENFLKYFNDSLKSFESQGAE
ncbi:MAG: alpha/beta hydrolase, partial [Fusobacteriaceae bacterium]